MRVIEFEIPEILPLLNTLLRMHWAQRRKLMERVSWLVHIHSGHRTMSDLPMERCRVWVERRSSGMAPDHDGLVSSIKPLMDVLVMPSRRNPHGLGIIRDDCPDVVGKPLVTQVKVPRRDQSTRVRIEEVSDEV